MNAEHGSAPRPLVVCCGLATLDVVQRVSSLPGPNQKVVAEASAITFGGPAANAAATVAALGLPARLVTALGSGPVADLVRGALARAGVQVLDLLDGVAGDPPVSAVLVTASSGDRAVVSVNATHTGALPPVPPGAVAGAATVLVDGHHLGAGLEVAAAARTDGVPVLLDGGSWKPGTPELLAVADAAVLSADFAVPPAGLAGTAEGTGTTGDGGDLAVVAGYGPALVARSDGARPVRYLAGGDPGQVPVPRVGRHQVVDTLGAGDVLHGAMAAAMAAAGVHGGSGVDGLIDALRFGVAVSSASVRHPGAMGWAAHAAELRAALDR